MDQIKTEINGGETYKITTLKSGAVIRELQRDTANKPLQSASSLCAFDFFQRVGDDNMIAILTAAKTDVVADLFVTKVKLTPYQIEMNGAGWASDGMAHLLSTGVLSQSEHDRIMGVSASKEAAK